jgi:RNA-directed DNA polymerase
MTNSDVSLNLDGGDANVRCAITPALDMNLMERVVERANMWQAWQRVKTNRGAPGSDGMSLEEFPEYARQHWPPFANRFWRELTNRFPCVGWSSPSREAKVSDCSECLVS